VRAPSEEAVFPTASRECNQISLLKENTFYGFCREVGRCWYSTSALLWWDHCQWAYWVV